MEIAYPNLTCPDFVVHGKVLQGNGLLYLRLCARYPLKVRNQLRMGREHSSFHWKASRLLLYESAPVARSCPLLLNKKSRLSSSGNGYLKPRVPSPILATYDRPPAWVLIQKALDQLLGRPRLGSSTFPNPTISSESGMSRSALWRVVRRRSLRSRAGRGDKARSHIRYVKQPCWGIARSYLPSASL